MFSTLTATLPLTTNSNEVASSAKSTKARPGNAWPVESEHQISSYDMVNSALSQRTQTAPDGVKSSSTSPVTSEHQATGQTKKDTAPVHSGQKRGGGTNDCQWCQSL